jgi:hypothetical protein
MIGTGWVLAASLAWASAAAATPSSGEAGLMAAWEASVRTDSGTVTFENVGEGRYRFATSRFPYDGELRVLSVAVEPMPVEEAGAGAMGTVDVELTGADEAFQRRYAAAVARWQAGNTLYWDDGDGRWLTAREWQGRLRQKYGRRSWVSWSSGLFWIFLLFFLVLFLWWATRRTSKQMDWARNAQEKALAEQARAMALSEKALALSEETNGLLAQILEELRKRG